MPPRPLRDAPGLDHERRLRAEGARLVAGVDEAGRGAWAGPVVAAVVVLGDDVAAPYRDSKALTPAARERLAAHARAHAEAFAVGEADPAEVDALGPLRATYLAVERAVARLPIPPDAYVTDALALDFPAVRAARVLPFVRAEQLSASVAAASLIAKTHRDALMRAAALPWPAYGFDRHKGYGVAAHRSALERFGPCPIHRRSYRPIAALLRAASHEGEA